MAVTKDWIEKEMPSLTHGFWVDEKELAGSWVSWNERHEATDLRLQDCELTYTEHDNATGIAPISEYGLIRVPLKAVDVGSIQVQEMPLSPPGHVVRHGHPYQVKLTTRSTADQVITRDGQQAWLAVIPVVDQPAGERVVRAIRHAAELCGAPMSPF